LTGIVPMLRPLAAAGLVGIMIGAVATHVRRKEPKTIPVVLGILAGIVAVGRFAYLCR
jgi:ammonia channel protein AmtB